MLNWTQRMTERYWRFLPLTNLRKSYYSPASDTLELAFFPFPEGDDIPGDRMLSHLQQSLTHSCTCIEHPQLLARIPSKMRIWLRLVELVQGYRQGKDKTIVLIALIKSVWTHSSLQLPADA